VEIGCSCALGEDGKTIPGSAGAGRSIWRLTFPDALREGAEG
jgi:hypothetical protein